MLSLFYFFPNTLPHTEHRSTHSHLGASWHKRRSRFASAFLAPHASFFFFLRKGLLLFTFNTPTPLPSQQSGSLNSLFPVKQKNTPPNLLFWICIFSWSRVHFCTNLKQPDISSVVLSVSLARMGVPSVSFQLLIGFYAESTILSALNLTGGILFLVREGRTLWKTLIDTSGETFVSVCVCVCVWVWECECVWEEVISEVGNL